jgi:hypothetical protein
MEAHDTFDHLASLFEKFARDFEANPKDDPDGEKFADGLGHLEQRVMHTYTAYHRAGAKHFERPRDRFAVLRRELAETYPQRFDVPSVATGRDGAPPYQWAVEDQRACLILAELARDSHLPETLLGKTDIILNDNDADLLRWLVERHVQITASDIAEQSKGQFGNPKTVGTRLRRLHEKRLVHFPPDCKLGAQATDFGREWVRKHPMR